MNRNPIPLSKLTLPVVWSFEENWWLLTAGENRPRAFNMMTISWGSIGVLWGKPMVMVVVRPSRHTYQFMETSAGFTLCAFPGEYKDELTICGTRSGRAVDKVQETGLTPLAATTVSAPAFDEAELILECRKMYSDDLKPANFLLPEIEGNYSGRDYHRMYFGEILAAFGTERYLR